MNQNNRSEAVSKRNTSDNSNSVIRKTSPIVLRVSSFGGNEKVSMNQLSRH
ncbi:hypothetical protein D920_02798 [Enterococcus faecalis 13-SD-W-01]|nr:hypothetical protein D920_02798 [Enterococcus faecalis 13-SD-W-01]